MAGVEHHRRKAARQCRRPLGRCTVYRRITAGLCGFRGAHGHADVGRLGRLTAFWPIPLGIGFQHRECFSPAHKLGILAAPEAFAAGQQPDSFQKVRLALPVVAADDGKLPAGLQPCRTNIAIVLYFQRKQTHLLTLPDLYALPI